LRILLYRFRKIQIYALLCCQKVHYKEACEVQALESEITKPESEKSVLLEKLNGGEGSPDDFVQYGIRYHEIETLLNEKTDRWLELSEIPEK